MTSQNRINNRPQVRWLMLARISWVVLTVILIVFFVAGLAPRFEELRSICADDCVALVLTAEEAAALTDFGLSLEFYATYILLIDILFGSVFLLLSVIIFWRRSQDWIGIVIAYTFVLFGLNMMVETAYALVRVVPELSRPVELLTYAGLIAFVFLIYFFPNGRFVPQWTRYVGFALVVVIIIDPIIQTYTGSISSATVSPVSLIVLLVATIGGVLAQIYRYRFVSNPEEKQQTKWVVFGLAALFVAMLMWSLGVDLNFFTPGSPRLLFNTVLYAVQFVLLMVFPLSIFFSILRYRLWEIDIVINRALVYGFLTGCLALVYFGSVVLLQNFSQAILGESDSPLVIVISTLMIAALFNPLRRRIQLIIDQRFYRRRYDAARTLEAFSAGLREQVELEELTQHLVEVVEETIQPKRTELWLKSTDS